MVTEEQEFVTQTALIQQYSWTKTLITKFLGNPDKEATNPIYRSACPVKLYSVKRINHVSQQADFLIEFEKSQRRKHSAQKAVESKTQKTLADFQDKIKDITVIYTKNAEKEALRDKQNYEIFVCDNDDCDVYHADKATKERWIVNYIRHNLTNYDEDLFDGKGKVGITKAYGIYKNAVLDKIAETYPHLRQECMRQKV